MAVAPAAQAKTVKCPRPQYDVRHLTATNVSCHVADRVSAAADKWLNKVLWSVSTKPSYRFTVRVCTTTRCERWRFTWGVSSGAVGHHHARTVSFLPFT